jgi:uridylate kinase
MNRVLLKISGEILAGQRSYGHDSDIISQIADDIKSVHDIGIQVCLVVGGGNIYRGNSGIENIERATNDYMGMLGTVINALALQGAIENLGIESRVQSAIPMSSICETYIRRKAIRHMERGRIVIFAAGTGNPFFTTDTAAVLRAVEMSCDLILKGTHVDGVYSDDPRKNSEAKKINRLSYTEVLSKNLKVLDASAVSLARDNSMPIIVFALNKEKAFYNVIKKNAYYSVIEGE